MDNLCDIIYSYLRENFSIILNFFKSDIFLGGGAIKDLILGEKIKDLDFVVFSNDDSEIRKFIEKFNLHFKKNKFDGYKIYYNNLVIDIWNTTNLFMCVEYNYDALFYNIQENKLFSFGFFDCIKTGKIIKINCSNNLKSSELIRIEKIKLKLEKLIKLFEDENLNFL